MRIALANHTPVFGSGSGTYVASLARSLVARGHNVCLVAPRSERFSDTTPLETVPLKWCGDDFPSFTGHPMCNLTYDMLNEIQLRSLYNAWINLFVDLKKWSPDIVHVQHLWIPTTAAVLAGFHPVVTCHGSELNYAAANPGAKRHLVRRGQRLSAVIYISKHVRNNASNWIERPRLELTFLNPYRDDLFYLQKNQLRGDPFLSLGFVGRLVAYKNCDQFLHCVRRLRVAHLGLHAYVVGDGPERPRLQRLAESLDLDSVVKFTGHVDQGDLLSYYSTLGLLIVPSQNEGFGLVVLEALACGTPVLVARSGGLAELVHPPYVVGFEPDNILDLTQKAHNILSEIRGANFPFLANEFVRRPHSLQYYTDRVEYLYMQIVR